YAQQPKHRLQRSHQQLATPPTIMAGSPSTAAEPYGFRDVDGGSRDIDRQSIRIRDRSVICTHAGWDYERMTDIIDTAENLLSKLIFHCVKRVESRIDGRPGAASTQYHWKED